MYNIPENYNFDIFKGRIIQQVCYSINNIVISFDLELSIMFNTELKIKFEGKMYEYSNIYPINHDYLLLNLLEKTVNKIVVEGDELLIILCDSTVVILYNNPHYESFSIMNGEDTLIV